MEREFRLPRISGGELASVGVIGSLLLSAAIATSATTPEDCLPYHDFAKCNSAELQKAEDAANLGWIVMLGGPLISVIAGAAYNEVEFRKRANANANSEVPLPNGS